jgi:hypothetical protein
VCGRLGREGRTITRATTISIGIEIELLSLAAWHSKAGSMCWRLAEDFVRFPYCGACFMVVIITRCNNYDFSSLITAWR